MSRRHTYFARFAFLTILVFAVQPAAMADDFGMIVKNIERHYNAKKKKIPFAGVAGFLVKIIHPAGLKNIKFAIFEDQDFTPASRDRAFELAVSSRLDSKWKPMVLSKDKSTGNRSYVYVHKSGDDVEMLTLTFSPRQAVVVQAKLNPDALARFMQKPEILGMSIARDVGGTPPSSTPPAIFYSNPGWRRDGSLAKLADPGIRTAPDNRAQPALRRRADDDSELDPVSDACAAAADSTARDVIHLETQLVNLNVKATDRSGNSLATLKRGDFRILEDGVAQDIFSFEPVSAPINLVLLMDLSGSTRDRRKVMIETAKRFIDSLAPGDRIAVAAFTREFVIACDFTTDKKRLKNSVDKMKKIEGGTAFYDAVWSTLDMLRGVADSRKAIVVLTDGVDETLLRDDEDEARTTHTFAELVERVQEEEATIYPIYLNPVEHQLLRLLEDNLLSEGRRARVERRLKPNLIAHRQIDQLADETAGTVFVAEGERELDGVYQRVAAELRMIYTLSYSPKRASRDGKFRKIDVTVGREGAVVKTRRGYIAR